MLHAHRNPSRPTAFIIALAVAFVLVSLFARDVFADHPSRDLDVRFTALDVDMHRGGLRVTYEIDHQDWHALQRAHIRPRLNLYAPGHQGRFEFVQSVRLDADAGTIEYARGTISRHTRFVEVRLSGERGRTRIARTSFGSDCARRVRLAVHRPGPPRGHGHGHGHGHGEYDEVALIEACARSTSWSGDLNQCIAKARNLDHDAPATIVACSSATSWSGDFLACLDLAANVGRNRPGTIAACSAATSWSGDFKSCLGTAAGYRSDASPTIAACKAATTWSGDFKSCLDEARFLGPRGARVVDACGAATSWSGEFKQCLVGARRG